MGHFAVDPPRRSQTQTRAVLDRASRGWRGVQQTIPSIRLLTEIRRELFDPDTINDDVAEAVTAAA